METNAAKALSKKEVQDYIFESPLDWQLKDGKMYLEITADDFDSAVDLLNEIATQASELHHHPDLCVKNYNLLTICLYTHSVNGISDSDLDLANKIYELWTGQQAS